MLYISLKLFSTRKGFQSDRNAIRIDHGKSNNYLGFIIDFNTNVSNRFIFAAYIHKLTKIVLSVL